MQEEYVTMRVRKKDQERLKKYASVGASWADSIKAALDKLEGVHGN